MSLADIDFDVRMSGAKTSEGDGRTAADIECERGTCACAQANSNEEATDGAE